MSLLGFTPGPPDVFGVPEQLSNFEPPGVCFVCASLDELEPVLADAFADAETDADADAEFDDDSSAFFA